MTIHHFLTKDLSTKFSYLQNYLDKIFDQLLVTRVFFVRGFHYCTSLFRIGPADLFLPCCNEGKTNKVKSNEYFLQTKNLFLRRVAFSGDNFSSKKE